MRTAIRHRKVRVTSWLDKKNLYFPPNNVGITASEQSSQLEGISEVSLQFVTRERRSCPLRTWRSTDDLYLSVILVASGNDVLDVDLAVVGSIKFSGTPTPQPHQWNSGGGHGAGATQWPSPATQSCDDDDDDNDNLKMHYRTLINILHGGKVIRERLYSIGTVPVFCMLYKSIYLLTYLLTAFTPDTVL